MSLPFMIRWFFGARFQGPWSLEVPNLSTTFEAEEIIFTMEETEEDPFFFKHDSLLPYRREVCSFFGEDWRCGLVGMGVGWVVLFWEVVFWGCLVWGLKVVWKNNIYLPAGKWTAKWKIMSWKRIFFKENQEDVGAPCSSKVFKLSKKSVAFLYPSGHTSQNKQYHLEDSQT